MGFNSGFKGLNYKQKSTLAQCVNKLRCSPANVVFLTQNVPTRRTATSPLSCAAQCRKQMPAKHTREQSGLIRFVS